MKLILKAESEKQSVSANLGLLKLESSKEDRIDETNKGTCLNRVLNGKRKGDQDRREEYKFLYKFNEGVTNKVTRLLPMNYFNS